MKHVAILGGSFNPFHNGHAAMVDAAREQLSVDEIWLMPAKQPPHKPSYGNVSDDDRIGMLKAYANEKENIIVSSFELEMEGFTYTANTLCELKKKHPDTKFYFLMGGDSFVNFHRWYKPEIIVKHAVIAICTREDCDKENISILIKSLKESIGGDYIPLNFRNVDVSSTMVRELIDKGNDVGPYVPDSIIKYIKEHNLYINCEIRYTFEQLEEKMRELLPEKRFKHVIGVKKTAMKLAKAHGCDVNKSAIAGILHDCAKTLTAAQLKNLCDQNEVQYTCEETLDEITTLSLLHSKAGSILAKNLYYIDDEEILSAIFYHTVGRPEMTLLEKIIFVADYIEPGRNQVTEPALDEIREISYKDIDYAVYLIAENTVKFLNSENRHVDEATIKTLQFYKRKRG